jgi:undecaprenyl-phosphate 4-deoxy-4-formamido-L-arabinose transferase
VNPVDASVSVVVPVYNGEQALRELIVRVQETLGRAGYRHEFVFVNDGSKDGSWATIKKLAEEFPDVHGFDLMRNYGQHNALLAGILNSTNDYIVTMDDDLQHPPEAIPELLAELEAGKDVAYGKPKSREHSLWRNISSKVTKSTLRIVLGEEMGEYSSAFRAFRSELKRGFVGFADAKLSIDVLLSWSARSVACVPIDHHPRRHGRSGYTLRQLVALAFSNIMGYSVLPLRVASGLGVTAAIFGLLLLVYLVIKRLVQETNVPGFAFIASEIALFAGLQLFAIGVIGEYLARVHFRTMGKPPFVIRDEVGSRSVDVEEEEAIDHDKPLPSSAPL